MNKFRLAGTDERPINIVYYFLKDYFQDGKKIVDVGCGVGRHIKLMPHNSVGIDVVMPPKDLTLNYNIISYDLNIGGLPFHDNSIDVLFSSHVIEHLRSPYDALKEFHRVLKRGGVLLIGVPNPNCLFFDFYAISKEQDWSEHLYAWDIRQARRFITNCGFYVINIYSNYPFSGKWIGKLWNKIPCLKEISPDLWFVAIKQENKVYLKQSKRNILMELLVKLGLGGVMSQPKER